MNVPWSTETPVVWTCGTDVGRKATTNRGFTRTSGGKAEGGKGRSGWTMSGKT